MKQLLTILFSFLFSTILLFGQSSTNKRYLTQSYSYITNQTEALNREFIIWSYPKNAYTGLKYMTISYRPYSDTKYVIHFQGKNVIKQKFKNFKGEISFEYFYYDSLNRIKETITKNGITGKITSRMTYKYKNNKAYEYMVLRDGTESLNNTYIWLDRYTLKIIKDEMFAEDSITLKYFDKDYYLLKEKQITFYTKGKEEIILSTFKYSKDRNRKLYCSSTLNKKNDCIEYEDTFHNDLRIETEYSIENTFGKSNRVPFGKMYYKYFY